MALRDNVTKKILMFYPIVALVVAIIAYFSPHIFLALEGNTTSFLTSIMFFAGLYLTTENIDKIKSSKNLLIMAAGLQAVLMIIFTVIVFKFTDEAKFSHFEMLLSFAAISGMCAYAAIFLGEGDVSFFCTLTAVSMVFSVVLAFVLYLLFAGGNIDTNAFFKVLSSKAIFPLVVGALLGHFLNKEVKRFQDFFSILSFGLTIVLLATIIAIQQ
ncbi:MAG: hypothetical protein ACK5LP_06695 [Campylobacteraceae bacterium]